VWLSQIFFAKIKMYSILCFIKHRVTENMVKKVVNVVLLFDVTFLFVVVLHLLVIVDHPVVVLLHPIVPILMIFSVNGMVILLLVVILHSTSPYHCFTPSYGRRHSPRPPSLCPLFLLVISIHLRDILLPILIVLFLVLLLFLS